MNRREFLMTSVAAAAVAGGGVPALAAVHVAPRASTIVLTRAKFSGIGYGVDHLRDAVEGLIPPVEVDCIYLSEAMYKQHIERYEPVGHFATPPVAADQQAAEYRTTVDYLVNTGRVAKLDSGTSYDLVVYRQWEAEVRHYATYAELAKNHGWTTV